MDLERDPCKHGTLTLKFISFTISLRGHTAGYGRGRTGTCVLGLKSYAPSTIHTVQGTILALKGLKGFVYTK